VGNNQQESNDKLYNSGPTRTFVQLIEKRYPNVNISELLKSCNLSRHEIDDENLWLTQKQINTFYENVLKATGNKNIAKEAGRYALQSEGLGNFYFFLLALGSTSIHSSTAKIYELSSKFSKRLDRSADYESKKIGKNKVEIIATPKQGVKHEPFQCDNRYGNIEQVPELFGSKLLKIEHNECIKNNNKSCRYIVEWKETKVSFLKTWKIRLLFLLPLISIVSYYFYPQISIKYFIPVLVIGYIIFGWFVEYLEKKQFIEKFQQLEHLSIKYDQLIDRTDINYDIAEIVREIGDIIGEKKEISKVLMEILQVIQKRLDFDKGMILLVNQGKDILKYRQGFGFSEDELNYLGNAEFFLTRPKSLNEAVVKSYNKKEPVVVNHLSELSILSIDNDIANAMASEAFICCPIIKERECIGILAVFHQKFKRELVQRDINLLMGIAPSIGNKILHNA